MNDTTEDVRSQRLGEIAKLVGATVAPELRATLQAFIAHYYGSVDLEDLLERQPADLCGAALSHWNFARNRAAERALSHEGCRAVPAHRQGRPAAGNLRLPEYAAFRRRTVPSLCFPACEKFARSRRSC